MTHLHPPRVPAELEELPVQTSELESGARFSDRLSRDAELSGARFRDVDLRASHLVGGDLSGARLEGGDFTDLLLERVNLANVRAVKASLVRVELHGCRLTGLQWAEGVWRDVVVSDCRADLLALRRTRLERVVFRDCILSEADFMEARMREVTLERCQLGGADLRDVRFERCELVGCDLEGLRGIDRLDGVTMPWADIVQAAGVFATALGVAVAGEDEA